MMANAASPAPGRQVSHRRYVPASHAHYGGNLVDGAYVLGMFGDVATELCIQTDADEGLFAAYEDVQFLAPIRAGDVVEATVTLDRVGRRSRGVSFVAVIVAPATPQCGASAAGTLDPPITAVTARGTLVVPAT